MYTYNIYTIKIAPFIINIEFSNITNSLEILKVISFYKNKKDVLISKITLILNHDGVLWYNDITLYKDQPVVFLLVHLKNFLPQNQTKSTHIYESDLLKSQFKIEILTLNEENIPPTLIDDILFKNQLFEEFMQTNF